METVPNHQLEEIITLDQLAQVFENLDEVFEGHARLMAEELRKLGLEIGFNGIRRDEPRARCWVPRAIVLRKQGFERRRALALEKVISHVNLRTAKPTRAPSPVMNSA